MPSYADDDLISLADESTVPSPISSNSIATSSITAAKRCSPVKRDSFSDLTVMMKAKKLYAPIPPPTPRAPLSGATNGMQFASRFGSVDSILSPLARPYRDDGSVVAYLQDQAHSSLSADTSPTLDYNQQDMQRLESMLQELDNTPVNDDNDNDVTFQLSHSDPALQPLLIDFELGSTLPVRADHIAPPTPVESTQPQMPQEPFVRVTMPAWVTMGRELEILKEEKRALERKTARLEKQRFSSWVNSNENNNENNDREENLQIEVGFLKYQNEQNKTQKATMARTLSQKDVKIKQLHLDLAAARESLKTAETAATTRADVVGERDYLQTQLREGKLKSLQLISELTNVKDREIQALVEKVDKLQEALEQAMTDNADSEKERPVNTRLEALIGCEKQLKSMNTKYAAEHNKANQLEDCVGDLRMKLKQVDDLQAELCQKSSDCDRWRTKYKNQEKLVETCKQQLERAREESKSLRGAAHLVKPALTSKLSPLVLGCAKCYTKNLTCDNKARCRNCTENNEQCSRWRCSLKHVLGQCPRVPCTFPHEDDGWIMANDPRPEW